MNTKSVFVFAAFVFCWFSSCAASDELFMAARGAELFSEKFEEGSVSERWGVKQYFIIEDGVLKRSAHQPEKSARVFLKDASFHNVIFQFDFKFEGSSELRLVTGGGGGYNTITQVSPKHFQVNTARRKDKFWPSIQGECAVDFETGKWYTMTVEFVGNEVVAHLDAEHFVIGNHPIIDTERTYVALQVAGTSAHFDNFKIWQSVLQTDWDRSRQRLVAQQEARGPAIERDVFEEEKFLSIQVQDRLGRTDETYRQLVFKKENLEASLKADYSKAFQSHKELSKSTAKEKSELNNDPRYKATRKAVAQAEKAVRAYVHSKHPDLEGLPKYIYFARYEAYKTAMQNDKRIKELEAIVIEREQDQIAAFPKAFAEVDSLVEKRREYALSLKSDPEFRRRKQELANAVHAIDDYVFSIEPRLKELKDAVRSAQKMSGEQE